MSPRLLRRFIPNRRKIRSYKYLKIFGKLHLDPNLWHWYRSSVAMAGSIGLFTAFMPIPFQMVMAATLAIIFRANLPVAITLVWITNPITISPIIFFAYKIGIHIMAHAPEQLAVESNWWMIGAKFSQYWQPVLVGLFTCAIVSAIIINVIIRLTWHLCVLLGWEIKHHRDRK